MHNTHINLSVRLRRAATSLAACLAVAAIAAAATASAAEPVVSKPQESQAVGASPAAAAAKTVMTPMSQEALLEHQAKHPEHLFVLDVRSPEEFTTGHVPGAVNVPYDQIATRLAEVPKDKDVVLYCRTGRRAGLAADVLAANGYTRLSHLEGDMTAWVEKGRKVEMP